MNKVLKSGTILTVALVAFVITFPAQALVTTNNQAIEILTAKELALESATTKEQVLSIVEDQDLGNMPIKKITQENDITFVSEQKSFGIEVEINTEENSVILEKKGVGITVGMPNVGSENIEMGMVDGQMVSTSDDLDVVVQSIEGGVRQIIKIDSIDASKYYDFPVELPTGYYLAQDDFGNIIIRNQRGNILTYIPHPWAKDADGNNIPTHYKY